MRKLDRAIATIPACLASYAHGRDKWDDVTEGSFQVEGIALLPVGN